MFPNPYLSATGAPMFSPSALMSHSGKRKRRHRTIFSEEQLAVLEATFNATQYPDVSLREKLAEQCELKEERVEVSHFAMCHRLAIAILTVHVVRFIGMVQEPSRKGAEEVA